jgi:uncharacterized LabA/DUF88 family protein
LPTQDRLNIAVFIDFDNIEIGVKTTLGQQFDVGVILDAIKERGEVVTKIAYADWTRSGEYSRSLTQHAIRLVQRNMTPGGDKNGADINLALDALEMAFTHQHINAYVIVGGDSDFLSLVEKLKQYDKKVFVVGGRAFTSMILQRNCHEFIAYENLHGVRKQAARTGRPMPASAASAPLMQAVPLVRRALKILADREVSPQTGLLKSTLLQLDSTFSERNYGASSFLDFAEKLAQAGVVTLKHAGRSVMVELNESFDENALKAATTDGAALPPSPEGFGGPRPASSDGTGDVAGCLRRPKAAIARSCRRSAAAVDGDAGAGRRQRRRRPRRRAHPDRCQERTVADVSPQRETDPSTDRGWIRRTSLRVRRLDGLAEGLPARGLRPNRARPPRRPARLPGTAASRRRGRGQAADPSAAGCRRHIRVAADRNPDERRVGAGRTAGDRGVGAAAESDRHDGGVARTRQTEATTRAGTAADGSGQEGRRRGEEAGGSSLDAWEKIVEQRRWRQRRVRGLGDLGTRGLRAATAVCAPRSPDSRPTA